MMRTLATLSIVTVVAAYIPNLPLQMNRLVTGRQRCGSPVAGVKGPPPIPSRRFSPLSSPDNFTATLKSARRDQITVVKFQAPWCRTCRAMAPKLDSIAKKFPTASYYSIESIRNGKAAGERMHKFFLSHNATALPYVEVYRGKKLLESNTIPPSQLELLTQALGKAIESVEREVGSRWRRERQKLWALLQPPAEMVQPDMPPAASPTSNLERFASSRTDIFKQRAMPRKPPRRGAPLRGATGPRGKRGYS